MENLSDIAVFVRVVQSGSFTAAAERLQLSRSVVSKYISRLEEQLNARLLNRTTRQLSLTEVGKVFYEHARRGLQEIEEAESELTRLQGKPRGILRINTPMSFGILHIASLLPGFQKMYPEIFVDMALDDRKVDVIEEGFDISVRITVNLPDSTLIAKKIAPCKHAIVATPDYLKTYGTPVSPAQLSQHKILTYQHQDHATEWQLINTKGDTVSVPLTSNLQMNNSLALKEALLGHMGIARMPTFIVGNEIQDGRLTTLFNDFEILEASIYLLYPQRRYLSTKVKAFIDYFSEQISETPYWDSN
tara:strand:+ start:3766 stop:4677 length:912 start_codon:yes stop_codon:yes gene_type:complete